MSQITVLLQQLKQDINKQIDLHITHQKNDLTKTGTMSADAFNKLNSFSQGGKGVRGGLFVLSSQMFGYNKPEIYDIAASLEIFQAALLIHDDIMDNDLVRRGNPSVFAQYIPHGEKIMAKDANLYGKSMGICIGDLGFFLAMNIFNNAVKEHEKKDNLGELLNEELMIVGLAQMDDVTFASGQDMPSRDDILRMYLYKTAHYTFSLPLSLGAIISGQSDAMIKNVEELGENLGLLFQIKDDEIGVYSTEKTIGKPVGSDLRENKKTFMRALLSTKINADEKEKLDSFQDKTDINEDDIQYFLQLLEKYAIKNEIDQLTASYQKKITQLISSLPIDGKNKETLTQLTDFVIHRTQ